MTPENPCTCPGCVAACKRKPGWFMPGEVAQAASLLGMSAQDFFDRYLAIDYYAREEGELTNVLSPATTNIEPGGYFGFRPHGRCVFLTTDDRCGIHAAKPFECAQDLHRPESDFQNIHTSIADTWVDHQDEVRALFPGYGEPPPEPTIVDGLDMLFAMLDDLGRL
jgi:Fe-S-cluster containining protein